MAVQTHTVEEFDAFVNRPENADRMFEFIGGEIVEVPSNPYSSQFGSCINGFIFLYLRQNKIGHLTGEHGGFMVFGERYAPDVAFTLTARQPQLARRGYNPIPPDLAVEVVSPGDLPRDVRIKVGNYLAAGVLLWVVHPEEQRIEVYAPGQPVKILGIGDILDGGNVLPGFTLPVRDIFECVE
jgi:Uma2 family endonuclease